MEYHDTVLFVDDEENILNSLRRGLIDENYRCLFALSGFEALEIMAAEPISVIVSDMKMPGMDGLRLLKEAKEKYPGTVRIVLSGYTQLQQILITVNQADIFKFITKPWKLEEEFKSVIQQALDYYHLHFERDEFAHKLKVQNVAYQNILKRIDNMIYATKMNSNMFAALAAKSFEIAMTGLDETGSLPLVRKRLQAANLFFSYFGDIDAEEPTDIKMKDLCKQIHSAISAMENVRKLDWDYSICTDGTFRTKPRLILSLVLAVIGVLSGNSANNYVKMLGRIVSVQDEAHMELTILTSDMTVLASAKQQEDYKRNQNEYMDALLPLAGEIAVFLGGTFQCARVDNVVLAKLVVKPASGKPESIVPGSESKHE